jgi:uncharacterized protein (TIGR02391 family)
MTQPASQPAQLSATQIQAAIPKLEQLVADLAAIDVDALSEGRFRDVLDNYKRRIDDTLDRVFGHNTIERGRFAVGTLDDTPSYLDRPRPSFRERQSHIKRCITRAINILASAHSALKERLEDSGKTPGARALTAYRGLDLHPDIARAASSLYQDGHYANAVEDAVKALNGLVRRRSGLEIDGTALMEKAFSPNNPILKFNDLSDQSERDEQKGFMMMFSGAVSGLRNPRAHSFIHDDPERALEFVAFVSLLAKLLDEAKK